MLGGFSTQDPQPKRVGVTVEDVYRINHGPFLSAFLDTSEGAARRQVKGLFCYVPADSLERVIVCGFREAAESSRSGLFQNFWSWEGGDESNFVRKVRGRSGSCPGRWGGERVSCPDCLETSSL